MSYLIDIGTITKQNFYPNPLFNLAKKSPFVTLIRTGTHFSLKIGNGI